MKISSTPVGGELTTNNAFYTQEVRMWRGVEEVREGVGGGGVGAKKFEMGLQKVWRRIVRFKV